MKNPTYLILDYETFSECDIKDSGAYEYAAHPTTEILCVGYVAGTRDELADAEPEVYAPPSDRDGVAYDTPFMLLLTSPDTVLVAHNAFFEQCISKLVLPRYKNLLRSARAKNLPPDRWICTASLARACGVPGNLEGATSALGLRHQKDMEGHRLMLKLCKPRKPTKHDSSVRHCDPKDLKRLYEYCLKDVEAERELFLKLPPLHQNERKIWVLNQKMNLDGFAVDRELVEGALHCIEKTTSQLDERFRKLTGLNSARQGKATLEVLKGAGLVLPNMQAATIDDALASKDLSRDARDVLEIRQAISKSSTAKYAAFDWRSRSDGRARDNTIYHGAIATGRAAGTGLQPQNLFKSTLPYADVLTGIKLMKAKDVTAIEALFEKPMELYSSAIRGCIVAPSGSTLDVGDFATIEVRVLFWLAGDTKGLKKLADGTDIYIEMAAKIFEVKLAKLLADYKAGVDGTKDQRQLGKATVLGSGFGIGLGGEKFVQAAKIMAGLTISQSLAQRCVAAYRDDHPAVVAFWATIERAATLALSNPGKTYKHGRLRWKKTGPWLTCELPSGRLMRYFSAKMQMVKTLYGEKMAITYRGVDSKTHQFIRKSTWGGKLAENVTQALARDLLMEALLRLDDRGHRPVLDVHDEIAAERADDVWGDGGEMFSIMEESPTWAEGLPIKVEGWSESRYRK